ncbi:hypothetical protein BH11VER1_BH11VER1_01310 [soil metagenome]
MNNHPVEFPDRTLVAPAVLKLLTTAFIGIGLLLVTLTLPSCSKAEAGPNGGDVVPLNNGEAKAEVMANADTGEMMVHTWDQNLKSSKPIENKPLMFGSGDQTIELQPHPTATDPSGSCSRFYGQADWLRGGQVHHGWMGGAGQSRHEFDWTHSWMGGAAHGPMWGEMGEHRRGMMGHGPGGGMGHK